MAYPTVSAPYGLKPVNLIGGQVFAGATRLMEIASGYATSIYYGDVVKRVSNGTIEKDIYLNKKNELIQTKTDLLEKKSDFGRPRMIVITRAMNASRQARPTDGPTNGSLC